MAIAGVAAFAVIGVIWNANSAPPQSPKPPASAQDPQRERDFQTVLAGARWLKQNQKNPDSFELIEAGLTEDRKAACYRYRARNSFNALVVEQSVIAEKVNSGSAEAFARHCAGKRLYDFGYARAAL